MDSSVDVPGELAPHLHRPVAADQRLDHAQIAAAEFADLEVGEARALDLPQHLDQLAVLLAERADLPLRRLVELLETHDVVVAQLQGCLRLFARQRRGQRRELERRAELGEIALDLLALLAAVAERVLVLVEVPEAQAKPAGPAVLLALALAFLLVRGLLLLALLRLLLAALPALALVLRILVRAFVLLRGDGAVRRPRHTSTR